MRIRKATREDCPAMLTLIRELAEYEKAPQEVTVDPQHFEESGFGEHPVWWALVAEHQIENVEEVESVEENPNLKPLKSLQPPQVVAFALYYIRYSTWKGQVMYLEDLLVTESMRGKGIGAKLLDRLIEEAKARGFRRIVWQVLDWNEPAIHFYKKYNPSFDPEWINVTLDL